MEDRIQKYQQLLKNHPENELARFSLGKAYYDREQYPEAKEQFERALERKPDWMMVQILIGKCELSLGNREAARAAFERGRQLAIDQEHDGPREEMEQLLTELNSPLE
jgi:tetratricopeptide (TPR) repeat protein